MKVLRAGHNDRTGHDKVYVVGIVPTSSGKFDVVARWGKRAASLPPHNQKTYHTASSLVEAERLAESTLRKKLGGGYEDVESSSYRPTKGRYTIEIARKQFGLPLADQPLAQRDSEPAPAKVESKPNKPVQTKSSVFIPVGQEVLVVCKDASGSRTEGGMDVRDGFDDDDEYVATASPLGDKYVQVFDRFGKPRSVPQGQFKLTAIVE